jgi:hypothetical protein
LSICSFTPPPQTYYPIVLLFSILTPAQGFLNYLVYIRPRFLAYRKANPEKNLFQVFQLAVAKTFRMTNRTTNIDSKTPGAMSNSGDAGASCVSGFDESKIEKTGSFDNKGSSGALPLEEEKEEEKESVIRQPDDDESYSSHFDGDDLGVEDAEDDIQQEESRR